MYGKPIADLTDLVWSREYHRARSQGVRDYVVARDKQDDAAARHAIIARYCAEGTVRLAYPDGPSGALGQPQQLTRP